MMMFTIGFIHTHTHTRTCTRTHIYIYHLGDVSLVAQAVKNLPAMQETWV